LRATRRRTFAFASEVAVATFFWASFPGGRSCPRARFGSVGLTLGSGRVRIPPQNRVDFAGSARPPKTFRLSWLRVVDTLGPSSSRRQTRGCVRAFCCAQVKLACQPLPLLDGSHVGTPWATPGGDSGGSYQGAFGSRWGWREPPPIGGVCLRGTRVRVELRRSLYADAWVRRSTSWRRPPLRPAGAPAGPPHGIRHVPPGVDPPGHAKVVCSSLPPRSGSGLGGDGKLASRRWRGYRTACARSGGGRSLSGRKWPSQPFLGELSPETRWPSGAQKSAKGAPLGQLGSLWVRSGPEPAAEMGSTLRDRRGPQRRFVFHG